MTHPKKRGPKPKYDLGALHRLLWDLSEPRRHHLAISQKELAEQLFVDQCRLSRGFTQLIAEGKLRRLGRNGNQHTLVVNEPA